jgi:predicted transcriptional regulator
MEVHLSAEAAEKLNGLALRTHRGADELLAEAVDHLVTWNDWFEGKVKASIAAAERGETVSDHEVRAWLEGRERTDAS